MTDLLALSDRILAGEAAIEDHHPFSPPNEIQEVGDGTAFLQSFANVSALRTGDGLALVDTGSPFVAPLVHERVRSWDPARLHTAVYTHGHIDHVFGTGPFEEEAAANGWPAVQVVAHEDIEARFDRYCACAGYNAVINQRQFQAPGLSWPTEYRRPDVTYRDHLALDVGGLALELHHARGETDDATWVWVPERRTVCTGDLVIWCTPNAGNPQTVQRYAREWAVALRAMAALAPELLLPGHGLPVRGEEQVRAVLEDTATVLEVLHDRTLALMNEGARLDDIVHEVRAPEELLAKPYLRPIYDDPEFVVRGV
ncbi:MAG TPA: MBL fold metallo-hydrolase [Iamia sp.]|nr:MBL fold metallo-hydrolase [Iamia sp.]